MVIVDTSVWISFFKGDKKAIHLKEIILENSILLHAYVYGELLLGGLSSESSTLLKSLRFISPLDYEILYECIMQYKLSSSGIGWVDTSIIASAISMKCSIFTYDEKLETISKELQIHY